MAIKHIILLFVETPRKFITARIGKNYYIGLSKNYYIGCEIYASCCSNMHIDLFLL